jgi:hypothetical protein
MKRIWFYVVSYIGCAILNYEGCLETRRLGQERDYCRGNFLSSLEECVVGFCLFCCKDDIQCNEKCLEVKQLDVKPISTCEYKTMGPSFEGFCNSLVSNNSDEYRNCIANFCEDCCFKELRVSNSQDKRVVECIEICMPGKSKENNKLAESIPKDDNYVDKSSNLY